MKPPCNLTHLLLSSQAHMAMHIKAHGAWPDEYVWIQFTAWISCQGTWEMCCSSVSPCPTHSLPSSWPQCSRSGKPAARYSAQQKEQREYSLRPSQSLDR